MKKKEMLFFVVELCIGALAILAYFLHWMGLFYILSAFVALPILVMLIFILSFPGSYIVRIYYILLILLFAEIGCLVTDRIVDGILLGLCFVPFVSLVDSTIKALTKKMKRS